MIRCIFCHKPILSGGILWGMDGDFLCDDECKKGIKQQMDIVNQMTTLEFYKWVGV